MAKREDALWLRRSAAQVVGQWTARRVGSRWAETQVDRDRLVRSLCLELIFAVARRIPDPRIAEELLAIHRRDYSADDSPAERPAPDFPRVTGNAQLLLGWMAAHLFGLQPYAVDGMRPIEGELTIKHRRNGNVYRVRVEQIAGTEFAEEATDAAR